MPPRVGGQMGHQSAMAEPASYELCLDRCGGYEDFILKRNTFPNDAIAHEPQPESLEHPVTYFRRQYAYHPTSGCSKPSVGQKSPPRKNDEP